MPSIAQQDYLRPSGKSLNDCHLFAALAHNIEQGTIFDTIASFERTEDSLTEQVTSKVTAVAIVNEIPKVTFGIATLSTYALESISISNTQLQYEGKAAIQDAGFGYEQIPSPSLNNDGFLYAVQTENYITCGGKFVKVGINEDEIIDSLLPTDEIPEDAGVTYDISYDSLQKLLGLSAY